MRPALSDYRHLASGKVREIYRIDDLKAAGSEAALKAQGKIRVEGKEYVMQDGDVVNYRFNV